MRKIRHVCPEPGKLSLSQFMKLQSLRESFSALEFKMG
jgi:hypothetical protein